LDTPGVPAALPEYSRFGLLPTPEEGSDAEVRPMPIAVMGASGYVGRRLVAHLVRQGRPVTAIGRMASHLPSGPGIVAKPVDVGDPDAIAAALAGADSAYYLVHAMSAGEGFAKRDRALATSFGAAARQAGVGRIVYLGGLGGDGLSEHLSSRQEVGRILRESAVPVVELRAAVILGAGSISFEMLRYLTERLPAMVCPRWVDTRLQPLAERDLLLYLEQSLQAPPGIYEIGAPEVTTYHDMMQSYAEIRRLRRRVIVKVPLLTPSLSARWVDLVTPVDKAVSHALIESLTNEVVVRDRARTAEAFDVEPMTVADALRAALDDQAAAVPERLVDLDEGLAEGIYVMRAAAPVPADQLSAVKGDLDRCGGDLRWYGAAWAWRLRMAVGLVFGERLRLRRPAQPAVGATADWWTIECIDDDRLVLGSTAWFFGDAWLGYRVASPQDSSAKIATSGFARIEQVAAFRPRGLLGLVYWRLLRPVHGSVFQVMVRQRVRRAAASRSD
jgi:uncharacterized protein YbjT (DUF2867 family)